MAYQPQTGKKPLVFEEVIKDKAAHNYQIKSVDAAGRNASTADLPLANLG